MGLPGLVGFGASEQALTILGASIDIAGLSNYAFSMPRDGTITSLAAYLSATAALALLAPLTYTVQVYSSTTDVFSPVPGALVNIVIGAPISIGDIFSGVTGSLSIPVAAGTRLLLVASATGGGLLVGGSVIASLSAGLGLE
ncbi:hypothetical protein SDC9_134162 [bioreactor metagenome]|uniref:BclB domain-containing protein n=1 Tax=bioreactor metagenome TaxID=1076179 RepID=A0A645DCV8_9ZZZZ